MPKSSLKTRVLMQRRRYLSAPGVFSSSCTLGWMRNAESKGSVGTQASCEASLRMAESLRVHLVTHVAVLPGLGFAVRKMGHLVCFPLIPSASPVSRCLRWEAGSILTAGQPPPRSSSLPHMRQALLSPSSPLWKSLAFCI